MEVGSYLEIFLTGYGWGFANIIAGTVASTGLVVIPFIWIILSTWKDAKERGDSGAGVESIVDTILVRVVTALCVYTLCFATTPITTVNNLVYKPRPTLMEPNPQPVSSSGTGTTFDTAMSSAFDQSYSTSPSGQLTYVPAWWYAVMSIGSGLNSAVLGSLSDRMSDLRELEDTLRTSTVKDSRILQEMQAFRAACFYPAKSKFLSSDPATISSAGQAIVTDESGVYGAKDVEWLGSKLFTTEAGFYDAIRPPFPVTGFTVDCGRDLEYHQCSSDPQPYYTGAQMDPDWGRPTCNEWWLDSDHGLRAKMVKSGFKNGGGLLTNFRLSISSEDELDLLAKHITNQANPQYVNNIGSLTQGSDELAWYTKAGRWLTGLAGSPKMFMEGLTAAGTMKFLMSMLPMVQAIVLLGLYMFLPMVTFLSGFDVRIMFTGAIAILTVKLWTAMWEIAFWIDARLMAAMFPQDGQANATYVVNNLIQTFEDGSMPGEKRILLNILMLVMFIGFPMVWTGMMAWVGARVGEAFGPAMKSADATGRGLGAGGAKLIGKTGSAVAKKL
ncbi:conjugal transfer protein TraG [Corticibacter populi]|uniref:Conjugal transfer protein TraG n=1 Tax=Corticibacter populi TaxID=1550736 RepID=A0A3M6QYR3_9BURK|nr:conjugal transfer protein TraG N-terminal domain-containing protein [Corticibacter populi]RMX08150.1 conjugal transfer protein TraG [Corticibacter populi]RZS35409.1 TraG-like protein [Corticibacter populi]